MYKNSQKGPSYNMESHEDPIFYFLIIENNAPIYQYPDIYENDKVFLLSGMLSAINSLALELSKENKVNNLKMGNYFITFSKDFSSNKIFAFAFSEKYFHNFEMPISIHMEFITFLKAKKISNLLKLSENNVREEFTKILEEFYRLKKKMVKEQ